jgi:YVTN family beta-propeller protein
VAVNSVANKIYVANETSNNITVIDGATNLTTTVAAGSTPLVLAVNPVTNKIYVANFDSDNVTVIDGVTNLTTTLAAGSKPYAVAVNPVTNKIYIANYDSDNVTAITEQVVQPNPLNVSINWLPGRTSNLSDPTFTILADSEYAPITPRVQQVYYQVDTWQGEWLSAIEDPGLDLLAPSQTTQWSAQIPPQDDGIHILYAYAVDGQDAGSVNPSPSYSPIIGRISAYLFLVREPWPVAYLPLVLR